MKIHSGDTVALIEDPRTIGIVERRSGSLLTIRLPERENKREQFPRNKVRTLAELMYEARIRGTKFRHGLSLTGDSTLAQLVSTFGYATERLRQESLVKVSNQLLRAGLEIRCSTDR